VILRISRLLLLTCIVVYAVALLLGSTFSIRFSYPLALISMFGMMVMAAVCVTVQIVSVVRCKRSGRAQ
jgi:hypothetical protein